MEGILSGAHSNLLLVQRPALLLFWFYFPFFGAYKKLFGFKKKPWSVVRVFSLCKNLSERKKKLSKFFKEKPPQHSSIRSISCMIGVRFNNRIAPNHLGIEVLSENGLLWADPLIQILHLQHVQGTENCVIHTVAAVGRKYWANLKLNWENLFSLSSKDQLWN